MFASSTFPRVGSSRRRPHSVNFFKFRSCNHTPPGTQKNTLTREGARPKIVTVNFYKFLPCDHTSPGTLKGTFTTGRIPATIQSGYGQETYVITTNRNTDSWTRYKSWPQAESLVSRAQTLTTNHQLEFCSHNVLISGF
jgi:hypothetical protein